MVKRAIDRICQKVFLFFTTRQDMTARENELLGIQKLKEEFEKNFFNGKLSDNKAGKIWSDNLERLSFLVKNSDPSEFLNWDVIVKTMFLDTAPYLMNELEFLRSDIEWEQRWQPAIKENSFGKPAPYWRYPSSSGNLIHHAYHLYRFEKETGTKIEDINFIFEFGGGYGGFCRLCHNLGFSGKYIIFDLPQFSALQRFYLESIGLKVFSRFDEISNHSEGILCLSGVDSLATINSFVKNQGQSLFIATWSLSETPVAFRADVLNTVADFGYVLIGYQDYFEGIDNHQFFSNWVQFQDEMNFNQVPIDHLKNNRYLFGVHNKCV